jgi:hypothetical protein
MNDMATYFADSMDEVAITSAYVMELMGKM